VIISIFNKLSTVLYLVALFCHNYVSGAKKSLSLGMIYCVTVHMA